MGGSVDCSDWPRTDCAVDFSPGEAGISYIRPGLWNDSLIDAAPVTGSLIYSAFYLEIYISKFRLFNSKFRVMKVENSSYKSRYFEIKSS